MEDVGRAATPALEAVGAGFTYGEGRALAAVSLEIPRGARVVLVGANGAGKSTLLHLLAGRRRPTEGRVMLHGCDAFETTELARDVALVANEWDADLCTLSVRQVVCSVAAAASTRGGGGGGGAVISSRAASLLGALGVDEALLGAELHSISAGERRRVQILVSLLAQRSVVLLDEATAFLDVAARASLLRFLRDESTGPRRVTVVLATHIFDGLDGWATQLVHLSRGALAHHHSLVAGDAAADPPPGAAPLATSRSLYHVVSTWLADEQAGPRRAADAAALLASWIATPSAALPPPPKLTPPAAAAAAAAPTRPVPSSAEPPASVAPVTARPKSNLPAGWDERTVAQAGAFGDHSWDAEPVGVRLTPSANVASSAPGPVPAQTKPAGQAAASAVPTAPPAPDAQRQLQSVLSGALAALHSAISACESAVRHPPALNRAASHPRPPRQVSEGDPSAVGSARAELDRLWKTTSPALAAFEKGGGAPAGGHVVTSGVALPPADTRTTSAAALPRASAPGPGRSLSGAALPLGWGDRQVRAAALSRARPRRTRPRA